MSNTDILSDDIVEACCDAGFSPIIDIPLEPFIDPKVIATIEYFEVKGWDAVRPTDTGLTFARWSVDDGTIGLMETTPNGVIVSRGSLRLQRQGHRLVRCGGGGMRGLAINVTEGGYAITEFVWRSGRLQAAVGGSVEPVPTAEIVTMWCHDEGKFMDLPINRLAMDVWIR